jgi:hypothetical protein
LLQAKLRFLNLRILGGKPRFLDFHFRIGVLRFRAGSGPISKARQSFLVLLRLP